MPTKQSPTFRQVNYEQFLITWIKDLTLTCCHILQPWQTLLYPITHYGRLPGILYMALDQLIENKYGHIWTLWYPIKSYPIQFKCTNGIALWHAKPHTWLNINILKRRAWLLWKQEFTSIRILSFYLLIAYLNDTRCHNEEKRNAMLANSPESHVCSLRSPCGSQQLTRSP